MAIKKYQVKLFLNVGTTDVPKWVRITKSTDNTITMNPETKDYDFIADESPTTEIERYKPSLNQPVTMYKGQADYEYLFGKMYQLAVGDDAKAQILIVFSAHGTTAAKYAWKANCLVTIDNMNPVDETITAKIDINGTVIRGTIDGDSTDAPIFTASSETETTFVVTVKDGASAVANATVNFGGQTATTGTDGTASFTVIEGNNYVVGASDGTKTATQWTGAVTSSNNTLTLTLA